MNERILVSFIVPIYNEEQHIEQCVRCLQTQDIPADQMEILLVDGNSTDNTMEILRRLEAEDPGHIRIIQNPKRIQAAAINLGARHARGEYIVRIDAHSEYPAQYASVCIDLLSRTSSANAGCSCLTKAKTPRGKTIAKFLTSSFAVGGSSFRVGAESGYVDTVPFGTFRRDYFLEIGGFDERLVRSEDNELNYRIRKLGGKIYMTSDMQTTYFCRETVRSLAKMAYANGKWTVIAGKFCPGSMSLKYFIPLLFALSILLLPALGIFCWIFRAMFAAELLLYCALALYSSLKKSKNPAELPLLFSLFPIFHLCYGFGSVAGIMAIIRKKY